MIRLLIVSSVLVFIVLAAVAVKLGRVAHNEVERLRNTGGHIPSSNHAHMARALDHVVNDDMVVLSRDAEAEARALLEEFYGPRKLPRGRK